MFGADLEDLAVALRSASAVLLGMGNPWRGDDGAGLFLVELLARRLPQASFRCLAVGENPENYLKEIRDFAPKIVVIFDAARLPAEPGEIRLLEPDLLGVTRVSTHTYALPILLHYLEREMRCRACLVGIAGEDYGLRDRRLEISPPVRAGVTAFADWLCERLQLETM